MTTINRSTLRALRSDIDAALAEVAAKHGVQIKTGSGSFARDGSNATLKLEIATEGDDGIVLTREATDFKRYAVIYGMNEDDLGRTFVQRGTTYKLIGAKPRAQKYPLIAERADGKRFKFPVEAVAGALA